MRAVYPRRVEMEGERKSIFWAWADQALHTSEQDWRNLGSGEGALARARIRRTISMGNRGADMTGSWVGVSIAHLMWVSKHPLSKKGKRTRGNTREVRLEVKSGGGPGGRRRDGRTYYIYTVEGPVLCIETRAVTGSSAGSDWEPFSYPI